MWKDAPPGFRFKPNKQEMINYLKNKILGKTRLGYNPINEINMLCYEPDALPALAKISSDDLEWYFYSPIVYANAKNTSLKRSTELGFWKPTGKDMIINDMSGGQIGVRKTLVYHNGKGVAQGVRTPWVMHEYHITCLPELPPHLTIYVLCHVKYKGHHRDISYGGNDSVVSHSDPARAMNTVPEVDQPAQYGLSTTTRDLSNPLDAINPNMLRQVPEVQVDQPPQDDLRNQLNEQTPEVQVDQPPQNPPVDAFDANTDFLMDELLSLVNVQENCHPARDEYDPDTAFKYVNNGNYGGNDLLGYNDDYLNLPPQTPYDDNYMNELIADSEFILQENRNVYMPRKALSGTIVSSDSDDSAVTTSTTNYQGPSSSHDSVGSSDSWEDLQISADLSVNRRKSRKLQRRRRTLPSKQKVKRGTSRAINASIDKETSMVKTEKETMETNLKKPLFIFSMYMIIGLIFFVGFIGNIKYWNLSVKF